MSFLTDLTPDDTVKLHCEQTGECILVRFKKKSGNKIRLAVDASRDIKISKERRQYRREGDDLAA